MIKINSFFCKGKNIPIKTILNFMSIFYILINTLYANSHINNLNYQIDGKDYSSYLVKLKGNTKGIIFIIHDWNGLNKYEKSRADMLAEEGYIGVALDLFWVKAKLDGFEDYGRETNFLYKNRKEFRKRIKSGLIEVRKILGNLKNQFIIGYCFGGVALLETAMSGEEMTGLSVFIVVWKHQNDKTILKQLGQYSYYMDLLIQCKVWMMLRT